MMTIDHISGPNLIWPSSSPFFLLLLVNKNANSGESQPACLNGSAAQPAHHIHCPHSPAVSSDWRLCDDRQQPQLAEHVLLDHRGGAQFNRSKQEHVLDNLEGWHCEEKTCLL